MNLNHSLDILMCMLRVNPENSLFVYTILIKLEMDPNLNTTRKWNIFYLLLEYFFTKSLHVYIFFALTHRFQAIY